MTRRKQCFECGTWSNGKFCEMCGHDLRSNAERVRDELRRRKALR